MQAPLSLHPSFVSDILQSSHHFLGGPEVPYPSHTCKESCISCLRKSATGMDPDPNADQRSSPTGLEKLWFFEREQGKLLLDCIRKHVEPSENFPQAGFKYFYEVLGLIKDKHVSSNSLERKKVRELWRADRITLYNSLMRIILGAEIGDRELWTVARWDEEFDYRFFNPGGIYALLLDYIHEHDDIVLKYYHSKSNDLHRKSPGLFKEYFWFFQSMERYRMRLIKPTTEIMKKWNEETEEGRQELLDEATTEFYDTVSRRKDSWRYWARMYWLLSRFQNAFIPAGFDMNYKYKTSEYIGPVGVLCRKIIAEKDEFLLEKGEHHSLIGDHPKPTPKFADKLKKDLVLGSANYSSLLAYACAHDDHALVTCILESKKEFEKHSHYDYQWEERWKATWSKALWNAAYKGHGRIVEKLILECSKLYSTKFYPDDNGLVQPLHVAALRGHESVVNAFCTAKSESNSINCHEEVKCIAMNGYTPLEVATRYLKDNPAKKKRIQSILLNKPEVKRAVEESYAQRELTVGSANAMMVGAALIAGVTYAGWLQPPLGYHPYYQFTEPVPGAPDAPLEYMFVQGRMAVRVFAIFNSLSFFFAIAAIVAGMETTCFIEEVEETYMTATVKRLRFKLKRTRTLFIVSVIFVLIAFSSAAIAILPPIKRYQNDMYVTIAVGGFVCILFVGIMLLSSVSKRSLYYRTEKHLEGLFADMKRKFLDACVSIPCKKVWKGIMNFF